MKNKLLMFIFISLFGVSAIIEPISSAADFVTGATYIVHNNGTDQVAGASTLRGSREDDDEDDDHYEYEDHDKYEDEEDDH